MDQPDSSSPTAQESPARSWRADLELRVRDRLSGHAPVDGWVLISVETLYDRGQIERARAFKGHANDRPFCGAAPGALAFHSMFVWITGDDERSDEPCRVELNFHLDWPKRAIARDGGENGDVSRLPVANLDEMP